MPELTVATFNVHGGMLTRGISAPRLFSLKSRDEITSNGAYDVVGAVSDLEADVVVIQESWAPDGEQAAIHKVAADRGATVYEAIFGRGAVDPYPHMAGRFARDDGTFGLAVLSTLPSRLVDTLTVGRVLADPAVGRAALHLELDVEGTAVDLVALHLTSRLPYGPPIQLRRVRRLLPPPGRPAILCGDFNFWGPPVQAMLPGWRRTVRGRTWPAHRPHSQIDHVLVRGDVEVVAADILPDVGSDHRPVRVRLRVGEHGSSSGGSPHAE
jgi:endonuclease/exonuclease/phosphatase family metal-dependent hydrolase